MCSGVEDSLLERISSRIDSRNGVVEARFPFVLRQTDLHTLMGHPPPSRPPVAGLRRTGIEDHSRKSDSVLNRSSKSPLPILVRTFEFISDP